MIKNNNFKIAKMYGKRGEKIRVNNIKEDNYGKKVQKD